MAEMMNERFESVAQYTDALEAVKELKGLQQLRQKMNSFEACQEEVSALVGVMDNALKSEEEMKRLKDEAKYWTDKLSEAEQTYQELNVPLDYSDQKRVKLFSRIFGLEFKTTEDNEAISFVFSNLSATSPSTQCSVSMDVANIDDIEQWKVLKVEPAVTGVQELVEQLNHTKELGKFCKQVRQLFKDHISQQQSN